MLNRSGIKKTTYAAPVQILANTEIQASVGTVISATLGATQSDGSKIVYAGTPCHVDFGNLTNPAVAEASGAPNNAVVLHDVDVTSGNANGTVLYLGVVNKARCNSTVQSWLTAGSHIGDVFIVNMP